METKNSTATTPNLVSTNLAGRAIARHREHSAAIEEAFRNARNARLARNAEDFRDRMFDALSIVVAVTPAEVPEATVEGFGFRLNPSGTLGLVSFPCGDGTIGKPTIANLTDLGARFVEHRKTCNSDACYSSDPAAN